MDGVAAEPIEEVGESSSPPRAVGGLGVYDIKNEIYERLVASGNEEVRSNPHFKEQFDAHFGRLPASYKLDLNVDRAEDVLIHQKVLAEAKDPDKRPVFHVRFMKVLSCWILFASFWHEMQSYLVVVKILIRKGAML
ncbi:hypothetical protein GW17_00025788 [Ensete ventricosum]|nr:hypothetical protein GW17_00025788 [Ensete ventricosum]